MSFSGLTTLFFWESDSSLSKSGSSMTNESICVAIGPSGSLSDSSCLSPFDLEAEGLARLAAFWGWDGAADVQEAASVAATAVGSLVPLFCSNPGWTGKPVAPFRSTALVEVTGFGGFKGFLEDLKKEMKKYT